MRGTSDRDGRWGRYVRALLSSGVAEEKVVWYVRWVERFERFRRGKPLEDAKREDVEAFISSLAEAGSIAPWQLRQAGDAVRMFLVDLRVRHPHRAGAAEAYRHLDDHDIHPCAQQSGARGAQPGRRLTGRPARP